MDAATLPSTAVVEGRDVVVVADPALAPGDAVVECDATTVESRIAGGLERARAAVTALTAVLEAETPHAVVIDTEAPHAPGASDTDPEPNGEQV